ncbi:MAG: hypothetical protein ACTS5I_17085 [Rhodanobacter sp.]
MFGYSIHALRRLCLRAAPPQISRHWRQLASVELLHCLPALGCVLYLPGQASRTPLLPSRGLLLGSAELLPLLGTHWVAGAGIITTDGPHEWIECVDRRGVIRARLHLLPDTDYLAWDELLATGKSVPEPACWRGPRRFRATRAQLCSFRLHPLAGLQVLDYEAAPMVSMPGCDVARQVAEAEAVPLLAGG